MKEVGIYIPYFNATKTIELCLKAVLKQTYRLKEILVVDDGSTDNSIPIFSRYPVRVIRHKRNLGLASARNTAIKNMNTEFIASLDADCLPDHDWLEHLMSRFNRPKIAGVGGGLLETYSSSVCDMWRSIHMKQFWGDNEKTNPPFLFGSNIVFRKEALINVGLYDDKFKENYEDVEICRRLRKARYSLIYEPRARARHLKTDDMTSVLDAYWKWHIGYYEEKRFYSDIKRFIFKIKDNIGLANRYIEEDAASERCQLIYLDFLLAVHHSLRDFEYFISQKKHKVAYTDLSSWLSLLDLIFFYHFDSAKKNIRTLIPEQSNFLQNFFALDLILGRFIRENFPDSQFLRIFYKHLFLSVYKINDPYLLDRLLSLVELHPDWRGLINKKHPNLHTLFLKNIFLTLVKWLTEVNTHTPHIFRDIMISAHLTEMSCFPGEEGTNKNENR